MILNKTMKTIYCFLVVLLLLMTLAACDIGGDDDDNNDNDNDDTDDDTYYDCDDVEYVFIGEAEPIFFEPLKCGGEEMFFTTPEEEPYNSNFATVLRSQEDLDAILEDFGVSCQVDFSRYMVPIVWSQNYWERKMCDAFERDSSGNPYISVHVVDLELKDEDLPPELGRSIHFGLLEASDRNVRFVYHSWGGEVGDP